MKNLFVHELPTFWIFAIKNGQLFLAIFLNGNHINLIAFKIFLVKLFFKIKTVLTEI